MAVIVRDNGGGEFERPEAGLARGVCCHVVDLGIQQTAYGDKPRVALVFEIDQKLTKGESAGKPFMLTKQYTASTNKKATLRHDLDSWRGRSMTEEEAGGFDLERLVGVNCMLNLQQNTVNDKTYTNITAILPPMKGAEKLSPSGAAVPKWLLDIKAKAMSDDGQKLASDDFGNVDDQDLPF